MPHVAFVKNEMVEAFGRRCETTLRLHKGVQRPGRAIEAGECNVWMKSTDFRCNANPRAGLFDFVVEGDYSIMRSGPGPKGMGRALLVENAHAVQRQHQGRGGNADKRGGGVFRSVALDLADIFKRQMKLVVILPARASNAAHDPEQTLTHCAWGAEANEQTVHVAVVSETGGSGKPLTEERDVRFCLNFTPVTPIYRKDRQRAG